MLFPNANDQRLEVAFTEGKSKRVSGGFVTDWKSGALGRPLQGGCTVTVRFDKNAAAPKSLLGDGVKAASDNAALVKWAPVVTEIGVNFPNKRDWDERRLVDADCSSAVRPHPLHRTIASADDKPPH
ncbi:hypothetical protein [Bradyrhizobium ganzhouense]|uniref:hypothetical protein n=1 Tax=Bradyrhizobium ganzhouense TaxID=1179767 RepID=UPI003CE998AE